MIMPTLASNVDQMENIRIVKNMVLGPEVHKRHISGLLLLLSSLMLLTACSGEHDAF